MVAEGPGRDDRHDDADDIDAQFEQIVAGLRAEQAASQERRREAIRRAQSQRREQGPTPNRPLEGFDRPNPWPPRPTPRPGPNPPVTGPLGPEPTGQGTPPPATPPTETPPESPPSGPPPPAPAAGAPPTPSHRREDPPGRHRARFGRSVESDYPEASDDDSSVDPGSSLDSGSPADSGAPAGSWRGWDGPDEEEHFIPPTPSLPAGDLHLWAIVAGLLGGPLILFLSNGLHLLSAPWWTPVGILLSVAGVVLLVLRLPRDRDDHDFTGGAQV